ncbi:MAG: metallophosphoesterase [Lachnospiraceae bacterium]
MKFIHIADTHLGAKPDGGRSYNDIRAEELWSSLSHVLEVCEKQKIELLLIAGDIFHRQPLRRELKELNYLFSKLSMTRVVFIAGNHDYIRPDSYYLDFQWCSNVFPLLSEKIEAIEFKDLELCVYGLSYHKREILEPIYDIWEPEGHRSKFKILLAHGGDDKHIPIKKDQLVSKKWNYVALGHLHKPQVLAANHILYSGALEPIDKNDTGNHGYILGELTEKGVQTQFIPSAKRQYIHMELEVDDHMTSGEVKEKLKASIQAKGIENLYKVHLTGFRDPDIYMDIHKMDTFGNILEIIDETNPAYDFSKLLSQNKDNLLGKYISSLISSETGSIEYQALYEGVQAILETKRG